MDSVIDLEEVTVEEFDLDLSFVEGDEKFAALMESTSDGCTNTRASACVTCT